jgi:hypothetical protein
VPVVLNRAGQDGPGKKPDKKPDKGAAKAPQTKSAAAKPGKTGSAQADPADEKKKLIALCAVIVLAAGILAWSMGLLDFGGSSSSSTVDATPGTTASTAPQTGTAPAPGMGGPGNAAGLRPGAGLPSQGVLPDPDAGKGQLDPDPPAPNQPTEGIN